MLPAVFKEKKMTLHLLNNRNQNKINQSSSNKTTIGSSKKQNWYRPKYCTSKTKNTPEKHLY